MSNQYQNPSERCRDIGFLPQIFVLSAVPVLPRLAVYFCTGRLRPNYSCTVSIPKACHIATLTALICPILSRRGGGCSVAFGAVCRRRPHADGDGIFKLSRRIFCQTQSYKSQKQLCRSVAQFLLLSYQIFSTLEFPLLIPPKNGCGIYFPR